MFDILRASHPELPILLTTRPKTRLNGEELRRLDTVKATYDSALSSGDKNVYFLDGRKLIEGVWDVATVDGCHPTDIGFYAMAQALEPVLRQMLFKDEK